MGPLAACALALIQITPRVQDTAVIRRIERALHGRATSSDLLVVARVSKGSIWVIVTNNSKRPLKLQNPQWSVNLGASFYDREGNEVKPSSRLEWIPPTI